MNMLLVKCGDFNIWCLPIACFNCLLLLMFRQVFVFITFTVKYLMILYL